MERAALLDELYRRGASDPSVIVGTAIFMVVLFLVLVVLVRIRLRNDR